MAPNAVIESLVQSFQSLGAKAATEDLRASLLRGARFPLCAILDKHDRYALPAGDETRGRFAVSAVMKSEDEFVAVVSIVGTRVNTTVRYSEAEAT